MAPCVEAKKLLEREGIFFVRVVSMPSWEIFDEQSAEYKASVLPAGVPKLAVEAGSPLGWWKYVGQDGDVIGLDRFGASAPGPKVLDRTRIQRAECRGKGEGVGKEQAVDQWSVVSGTASHGKSLFVH